MRFFLVIALCITVASATYTNKYRFEKLLNRYRYDDQDTLFGSNDVDDHIDEYVDEIRRQRHSEIDQCPRDLDEIMDTEEDTDFEDIRTHGRREYETDEPESKIRGDLIRELEDANTKLATRLYKQAKDERDDKNTLVSPISIQLALAALNSGARGNTKRQIGRVIAGRLQQHERRQIYTTLIRKLRGYHDDEYSTLDRKAKLQSVTGIFLGQSTRAQQNFVQLVKQNLDATVKHCNFQRQPQKCRQTVNGWMAEKTQGKFTHIVPQDAITDNTKMILINAMNVKATWAPQVRKHTTKEAKFYPLDSKKVKIVEVLETEGRFKYHEDELVKIVGLPTDQKELTLYVIVPKDKDGLTDVEKMHLHDSAQLKRLLKITDQKPRHVGLQLPKFQIKHKIDVRRTLRNQGVQDAFDPQRADFSGITGASRYEIDESDDRFGHDESTGSYGKVHKLHLNKFVHQSTIKITEHGITATTGSGSHVEDMDDVYDRTDRRQRYDNDELNTFDDLTGFKRRESSGEKIVKANHAFAFVLKHNPTNQLVFVGRVIDAAQKKVNHVPQTINSVDQY